MAAQPSPRPADRPDSDGIGSTTMDARGAPGGTPPPDKGPPQPPPSQRSLRALDWFVFLIADVQTGFGPFVAVYLTSQQWTQIDIGLVMTAAGLISLIGQMPGGALVDAARSERVVAAIAVCLIGTSALAYATW